MENWSKKTSQPILTAGYGNIRRSVKAKDNMRYEDYQQRYKCHKLKIDHKKRDLEYIYRKIDADVMDKFGYRAVI